MCVLYPFSGVQSDAGGRFSKDDVASNVASNVACDVASDVASKIILV